jgi:predicted permease
VTGAGFGRLRRGSAGGALIAGQVALSVVLLVGAAMLTRSLRRVQSVDLGLDRDHLLILEVDARTRGYDGERLAALAHALRERLEATPGVTAAAYSDNGIFSGSEWHSRIAVPGFSSGNPADSTIATDLIGPDYFRAIGGRILSGRELGPGDEGRSARIAVVNSSFARFYFGTEAAVGRTFTIQDSIPIVIVGVAADVRDHRLAGAPERRAYYPYLRTDPRVSPPMGLRFAIRTRSDPATMVDPVRAAVAAVDPQLAIDRVAPLGTLVRQSIREERLVVRLASVFGILALVLAATGLYGILTQATRRRTVEIGLRAALGAGRGEVVRLVVVEALTVVGVGAAIGLPLALGAARLLRAQLHEIGAVDPISIALVLVVLALSASAAALVPAVTAARVSPLVALRAD